MWNGNSDRDALDSLMAELYAPWDAWAWQNLSEDHSDVAAAMAAAVQTLTPEAIRRYGEAHGYPPRVIGWLEQACRHVRREREATAD